MTLENPVALTFTPVDELNSPCPDFRLPATDGKTYSLNDFKGTDALLIMFICNHCPYVKAIEDRLIELGHDLKKNNISLVAICANDSEGYPEDNFENLKKRAEEKKYPFVYLHDESQAVAKKFGAVCTPDFFLYDKDLKLKYRGRLDDSWKDAGKVSRRELFEAALSVRQKKEISFQPKASMGCSIKWK